MSTVETVTGDRPTSNREDPSSWWYGGSESPLTPDTVVVRSSDECRLHLKDADCVPDESERRNELRERALRTLPPAFRDPCPRCWPEPATPVQVSLDEFGGGR